MQSSMKLLPFKYADSCLTRCMNSMEKVHTIKETMKLELHKKTKVNRNLGLIKQSHLLKKHFWWKTGSNCLGKQVFVVYRMW